MVNNPADQRGSLQAMKLPRTGAVSEAQVIDALPRRAKANFPEEVVSLATLGGIVYVATTAHVYRVEGDRLVRLAWPKGPARGRKGGGG